MKIYNQARKKRKIPSLWEEIVPLWWLHQGFQRWTLYMQQPPDSLKKIMFSDGGVRWKISQWRLWWWLYIYYDEEYVWGFWYLRALGPVCLFVFGLSQKWSNLGLAGYGLVMMMIMIVMIRVRMMMTTSSSERSHLALRTLTISLQSNCETFYLFFSAVFGGMIIDRWGCVVWLIVRTKKHFDHFVFMKQFILGMHGIH